MLVASMRSVQIAASPPAYGSRAARCTGSPTTACASACSDTHSGPGEVDGEGDGVRETEGDGAADRLGFEDGVPAALGEALAAARVAVPVRVAVAEGVADALAGSADALEEDGDGAAAALGLAWSMRARSPVFASNTSATALASSWAMVCSRLMMLDPCGSGQLRYMSAHGTL